MKISDLLNPETERRRSLGLRLMEQTRSTREELSDSYEDEPITTITIPRSSGKEPKDAAKFARGDPTGEVRYPPHEPDSSTARRHLKRYCIFPENEIDAFPRHIPYSSDKKRFTAKTGRESFEVFQYTFRYREDSKEEEEDTREHSGEKEWVVMWDYNIGLVRITPFFKCQDYQKTIPAKVIAQNAGLGDLCHSITGGALAAQGYWMPFPAARAIAATFCYKIRYALLPLFGLDFLDLCVHPSDPAYKRFTIDPAITASCAAEFASKGKGSTNRRPARPQRLATTVERHEVTAETLSPESFGDGGMDDGGIDYQPSPPPPPPRSSRRAKRGGAHQSSPQSVQESPKFMTPSPTESDTFEPQTPPSLHARPGMSRTTTPVDREWLAAISRMEGNSRMEKGSRMADSPNRGSGRMANSRMGENRRVGENSNTGKRRLPDVDTGSDTSTPAPRQQPNKRKKDRAIGQFSIDEARAAYQLLELHYSRT